MKLTLLVASIAAFALWSPPSQAQNCPLRGTNAWITDYGARATPSGMTPTIDNLPAIQAAISCAKRLNVSVYVPPGLFSFGRTTTGACTINPVTNTPNCPTWFLLDGVQMTGQPPQNGHASASVLYALDPTDEAIVLAGNRAQLRNLTLTGAVASQRLTTPQSGHVWVLGEPTYLATNFVIDSLTINGSASVGIITYGAGYGVISNNTINNTMADSIHMTNAALASHDIEVKNNTITNSGDDGIVVLSYQGGGYVNNINIHDNQIMNNVWGRNMAVVGGQNVSLTNNLAKGNGCCACLYIAEEDNPQAHTLASFDVIAQYNTLENCGNAQIGYAAVTVASFISGYTNDTITLARNYISPNPKTYVLEVVGYNKNVRICKNAGADYSNSFVNATSMTGLGVLLYATADDVGYSPGRTNYSSCP